MSGPVYTHAADADLEEIGHTIGRVGGARAAARFLAEFHAQADSYARSPEMGIPREDVAGEYRSFVVRKYVAFYRVISGTVVISRVLHGAADATAALGPP